MRYLALASDYDGTLASDGQVSDVTLQALKSFRATGRKLILVSGRVLADLARVFPRIDLFEMVVAENGAVLYRPADDSKTAASGKIPRSFIDELKARGVSPLDEGEVIVATWEPNEIKVLSAIRDLGLELDVIFNKGAVMILPAGVNKGSGLSAALKDLQLSAHNVVGIGDAENDHAFLQLCECSVAVANALPNSRHGSGLSSKITIENRDSVCVTSASALLQREKRGHRFNSVPQILQAQVFVGSMLIVVVIGDRYRDGAGLRGAFHRSERNASSHSRQEHHLSARTLHRFNDFPRDGQIHGRAHGVVARLIA